jgi:hypothetical protein
VPADKWPKNLRYKATADNLDALIYGILLEEDIAEPQMGDFLYRDRLKLSLYGLSLLGLAFDRQQQADRRDMILRNLDQFVTYDEENQTAYLDLQNDGYWWNWYGSNLEANAFYLKLLARVNPQDPKAAGVVKYLLNNRRNGTYWTNTRDTAYCIEAMAEYLDRSGEGRPGQTVEIWIGGKQVKSVEITPEVMFQYDDRLIWEGSQLTSGTHDVEIRRVGDGNVYVNAYLTNFSLEDNLEAAGLEVKIERQFYRLEPVADATSDVSGTRGQVIEQAVEKYRRVRLENWHEVQSGDLIEIELLVDSKNDYEYVILEDQKIAGCEPVELLSGYLPGRWNAYIEFRDQRVCLFTRLLTRGEQSFRYRMRAEIPGKFSALPARAWAMYAPELRGNSAELKLEIIERGETR